MKLNIVINPNWCPGCQNWNGKLGGGCTLPEDENCANLEVWPLVMEKHEDVEEAIRLGEQLAEKKCQLPPSAGRVRVMNLRVHETSPAGRTR